MNAKIDRPSSPLSLLRNPSLPAANATPRGKEADNMKSVMDCTPCHSGNEHLMNKVQIIPQSQLFRCLRVEREPVCVPRFSTPHSGHRTMPP